MSTEDNGRESNLHRAVAGEPHPDVYIMEHNLRSLGPGQVVLKETLCAALGLSLDDWETVYRRARTAQNRLRRERINIEAVRGEGYQRELGQATVERVAEGERQGIQRRATRNLQRLANVDAKDLTPEQRLRHGTAMTLMAVTRMASSAGAQQRMLTAGKKAADQKRLPMADALKVLAGTQTE